MNSRLILFPVIVQILLTMAVYVALNAAKHKALRNGEVDSARRALDEDAWPDRVRQINNNIRNQFEVPVLFYVLALIAFALNAVGSAALAIAWLFALSRVVHAWIHVGSNYVPYRRKAFMVGCVMVVALAIVVLYGLIVQ